MNKNIAQKIIQKLEKGEQISPFLFVSEDDTDSRREINNLVNELEKTYHFPQTSVYRMSDNGESLKIQELRMFMEKSYVAPHFKLQFFIIENISRFTRESSHSLLKFFEEPGVGNVILLSNASESSIIDTILSRITTVHLQSIKSKKHKDFIVDMLEKYVEKKDRAIVSYYFSKPLSSEDALDFLYSFLFYIQKSGEFHHMLSNIQDDIVGIESNNFSAKYVIDRYLLEIH